MGLVNDLETIFLNMISYYYPNKMEERKKEGGRAAEGRYRRSSVYNRLKSQEDK